MWNDTLVYTNCHIACTATETYSTNAKLSESLKSLSIRPHRHQIPKAPINANAHPQLRVKDTQTNCTKTEVEQLYVQPSVRPKERHTDTKSSSKRNKSKSVRQLNHLPAIPEDKRFTGILTSTLYPPDIKEFYLLDKKAYAQALAHANAHANTIISRTGTSEQISAKTHAGINTGVSAARATGESADVTRARIKDERDASGGRTADESAALPAPDRRKKPVTTKDIKRLNRAIRNGDLRAITHWSHAIRSWTRDVDHQIHAISEGTKIIDSLVKKLTL